MPYKPNVTLSQQVSPDSISDFLIVTVNFTGLSIGEPNGTAYIYRGTNPNDMPLLGTALATWISELNNYYDLPSTDLRNTRLFYKVQVSNSEGTSPFSDVVSIITFPSSLYISVIDSENDRVTINVRCETSGNALTTKLQTSDDNVTWTDTGYTNVQGNSYTFTYTNLSPGTSYTKYFRVTTSVGSCYPVEITFRTTNSKLYGSVNNAAQKAEHMYGSVNRRARKIRKLYGSVNGRTKLIFQE
jgi:hypothetical protein